MAKRITIDGIIGLDTDDRGVREQLELAKGEAVIAEIASPGGLISEGLKIYNTLKNYKGRVDTHLIGSVASMATYIAMVGEKRTAEKNAVFMIHNGRGMAIGDHKAMFKIGKHLDALSNMVAKEYSAKSNTPLDDIRSAMDDETFYYGDEIQTAGFVHEMAGKAEPEDRTEAIAMAELMIDECQEKINQPESFQEDMTALATMMEQPPKGENNNPKKEIKMEFTLENLKKEAPDLLAQIQTKAKAAGHDEGLEAGVKQERERVSALLKIEDADAESKTKAITDGLSVDASYRLFFEAEKKKKAEDLKTLENSTPGSVGQQGKETGDNDSKKTFMAAVDAHQKETKCTRTEALTAVAKANPELHAVFVSGK